MKLYTFPLAPSPRRIHLFMAEKGLEIEQQIIDLRSGEHLTTHVFNHHQQRTVPALELDDGTLLTESVSICRYLEEFQPEPPLLGKTMQERALIADCDHWIETHGLLAVAEAFRNQAPSMRGRAVPGPRPVAQIPELAERGRQRFGWFIQDLDQKLAQHAFVAGDDFSVADITAFITIEFATGPVRLELPVEAEHVADWFKRIAQRPAVKQSSAGSGRTRS